MSASIIKPSFSAGELSPNLYGRIDLAKWHNGVSTGRNMFVDYRGGMSSRAGLAYCGTSRQAYGTPPRLIPFRFSVAQNYALEFGEKYMRVIANGGYVTEAPKTITGASQSNPAVIVSAAHGFANGDWVYISGVSGMTALNGLNWIVANATTNTFTLVDMFGVPVSSVAFNAYISGGTAARLYTLTTPYAASDLSAVKFAQSADVMTLCHPLYAPRDLTRIADSNWTLTVTGFTSSISAPLTTTLTASTTTVTASQQTTYQYVVTAVSADTGEESVASPLASVTNSVNIGATAGTLTVNWTAVAGAGSYNLYKAPPAYGSTATVQTGSLFGYAGTALGLGFTDTNITQDFTRTPPLHINPFAVTPVTAVTVTAAGTGYVQSSTTLTITTSTGSGAVLTPVVNASGGLGAVIIVNGGQGYAPGDTIAVGGAGSGALATLTVGAASGTYPSVVAYFQQRRAYANTTNNPDTYFMSKPGAFTNFDASIPTNSGDSITGTPWATQVNGIRAMVPMPGGLVILTGLGAWQLNGGANNAPLLPNSQSATPQAYYGCSPNVPPIPINYDVLYVQEKGSLVINASYNFFVNIYAGEDITLLSNHLFDGRTIKEWAWAEAPYKIVWSVLDNGHVLSLTYLKTQEVMGWTRHDTQGLFVSVCSISEPPIDAVYFVVQRYVKGQWLYYIERMDNRIWPTVEDCFCIDSGLENPMAAPAATLSAAAATGANVLCAASANVFAPGDVGSILRMGGGLGTVTSYINAATITVTWTVSPEVLPGDLDRTPIPVISGAWTLTPPVTRVTGLNHLEGKTVSILADGSVSTNQVVAVNSDGTVGVSFANAVSNVKVGLPFQAQLQSLYMDIPGEPTVQGKVKSIPAVTVRVANSRGIKVGSNQVDAATQPNQRPTDWSSMKEIKDRPNSIAAGLPTPLFSGDYFIRIPPEWNGKGQIACQQDYPLPMTVTALIADVAVGDTNG